MLVEVGKVNICMKSCNLFQCFLSFSSSIEKKSMPEESDVAEMVNGNGTHIEQVGYSNQSPWASCNQNCKSTRI